MYYKIFESCEFTLGYKAAIVIDWQRSKIFKLPKEFALGLQKLNGSTLDLLHVECAISVDLFKDMIEYVVDNEIILVDSSAPNITAYCKDFKFPSKITNAIIVLNGKIFMDDYIKVIEDLDKFNCKILCLICRDVPINCLEKFLSLFDFHTIENIVLYLESSDYNIDNLSKVINNKRVSTISVFSSKIVKDEIADYDGLIDLRPDKLNFLLCGNIDLCQYNSNKNFVFESKFHNSCLNRKISIDSEGNIKNCPSMTGSYGNIRDTSLAEAIDKPGFRDLWDINKDKIHVCKDCEYRYVCTDCRANIEDPDDVLSKPLKCGYNPYTGEWSEWSTNPLKQKAIDFYGMRDILPKADA